MQICQASQNLSVDYLWTIICGITVNISIECSSNMDLIHPLSPKVSVDLVPRFSEKFYWISTSTFYSSVTPVSSELQNLPKIVR